MITVISRPIGHKLTEQELDGVVTDQSGEALVTTEFAHGLVDGDYIYIQSNIESYNGFKYVDQTAYNTFLISNSKPILPTESPYFNMVSSAFICR